MTMLKTYRRRRNRHLRAVLQQFRLIRFLFGSANFSGSGSVRGDQLLGSLPVIDLSKPVRWTNYTFSYKPGLTKEQLVQQMREAVRNLQLKPPLIQPTNMTVLVRYSEESSE